jgi:uncharacterized protein (DUF433 family)
MIVATMTTPDRIVIDPAIAHGKAVIRGTRIPATLVVGSLAGGMSFEEVQREYDLAPEDIRAALKYVGEIAAQESVHRLPAA